MNSLKLIPLSAMAILALAISTTGIHAKTEKYRLIWNNAPESSITVGWCQKDGENPRVHYGEANNKDQKLTESHGVDHKSTHLKIESRFARLTGLKADTLYHFVIRDSNSESRRFSFRTAPAKAASFSFAAGGDSRNHRDARQRANRVVAKIRPLFVCFGGDMINKSNHESWAGWLDDWQLTTGKDGHMIPIIAARGNHEGKKDIHAFFDTPHADDYYAVGFGNGFLRVYTLNSNIVRGGEQGKWLAEDLTKNNDTHWKVAHYHHPFRPHQSGKSEQDAQYKAWAPLFFKHEMNLAIECDSHVVKRTWPIRPSNEEGSQQGFIRDDKAGTVFIGEGCWGAPLRRNNDDKSWTRASGSFNQVNWICVTPEKMFARSILADSVENASQVKDSEPFTLPEGLKIWEPESGAEVVVRPRRSKPVEP
ncbi:MAG: metallophosphoesterase family protein [Verrucomicrobiota bacterium]|nr:metallophosphoesterase family protein [Verrucomicrobiota bacterium]